MALASVIKSLASASEVNPVALKVKPLALASEVNARCLTSEAKAYEPQILLGTNTQ